MQHVLKCIVACALLVTGCVERNPAFIGDASVADSSGAEASQEASTKEDASSDGAMPTDATEPNPCKTNDDCPEGSYCHFDEGCGEQAPGLCRARPKTCPKDYSPVCGCDDQTYGNPCMAASAGVSVRSPGECEQQPTCEEIEAAYREAIEQARACKLMQVSPQCTLVVEDALLCPCQIHVNEGKKSAVKAVEELREAFFNAGCEQLDCDRACPFFNIGLCLPSPNGGQCQEV